MAIASLESGARRNSRRGLAPTALDAPRARDARAGAGRERNGAMRRTIHDDEARAVIGVLFSAFRDGERSPA